MTNEQIKALCWVAWRIGSIGSETSYEDDLEAFEGWWKGDALFLIEQGIEPFDSLIENQKKRNG